MPPRLVQRLRKIVDFKTDVPRELKRQLRELEQGFADALAGFADGIAALFTGLDGVNVIGNTVRSSRDVKIYTAGGNNLGDAATADILRFELTAHATVTGFTAPGKNDTNRKLVVNASAYTLTLSHDATSATKNRLYTPHLVAFELRPSECTWIDYDRKSQRWRVTDQSQPFHIVRTLADLPAVSSNIITLPVDSGEWFFAALVNLGTNVQLYQSSGATLSAAAGCGVTANNSARAVVKSVNLNNARYFYASNAGAFATLECSLILDPYVNGFQNFTNWFVGGASSVLVNSTGLRWNWGKFLLMTITAGVGVASVLVSNTDGRVVTSGTGNIGQINLQHVRDFDSASPLLEITANVAITSQVKMIGCETDIGKLFKSGAAFNFNSTSPRVQIISCRGVASGSIDCSAVPNGGIEIIGNILGATPFSGFTALSAGVTAHANYDILGVKLQETPNGHIVKNNAGTAQTQRHYLMAGTGLEATDDGTNSVFSLSSLVTDTLTFADDATYGYELSAQLPVTSLPSSCIAAVRIACAWGATAASGGAVADIDRDGSGWVYLQVTKNSGTLVQVEYTYDRLGTPVPEYHIVHEDLFDDGNNPSTAGTFYVQITSGQIEVFVRIPGTGTHSGATHEGTATMYVDSVHTRTALS